MGSSCTVVSDDKVLASGKKGTDLFLVRLKYNGIKTHRHIKNSS